ncbi:MAG TPA: phosphoribosylglycinamide formyltransferase [Longimicrobium sp.]|nr:phosphoribosylglycinamide formyltransferase [Longimicrobium sp.]
MREPKRVAVLSSGGGTNLQALIARFNPAPAPAARVELVIGGRAGIAALQRAARAGVPAVVLDAREIGVDALAARMLDELERHRIDIVVLAGWLQLIPLEVVRRYEGRMLNIHPALLPAFGGKGMYGIRVHRAVLESGVRVSGATVHHVTDRYDEGSIVLQWPVPVLPGDTPEALALRVLAVEHRILPLAVEALASGDHASASPAGEVCFDLLTARVPPDSSVRALLAEPGSTGE